MALPVLAESPVLSRVESAADQAWISVKGLENVAGESATVFGALARAGVNVDVIVQAPEFGGSGGVGVAFTCPQREGDRAVGALLAMSGWEVGRGRQVGKVTLWGAGFRSHPRIMADFMDALSGSGIQLKAVTASAIQISALVDCVDLDAAALVLKTRFCL